MDKNDKVKKDSRKQNSDESKDTKRDEVELLKTKAEELEDKYKRALADYQNLEKRAAEERREWILKANKDLLLHLLPVLDTLILAEKHIKTQNQELALSLKQFLDILKGEGVTRIDAVGKSFDPHFMECVETIEGEEGKVVEELRSGYMFYDKVLRPVLVKVGKTKAAS
jgi:molecular chaperone GrpE